MTSREAALVLLAQRGRQLRYADGPPRHEVAERMLEIPTAWLREAHARLPGLAGHDLDATLGRLEHDWIEHRGTRIHVEAHQASTPAATAVFVHGLGDHARRSTPLGGALAEAGFNAVLVDRHGHGLSEGRRGDATLETDLGVVERAIAYARERFGGPVVLIGDSLGGIIRWYLLTREPDVDAAVCHCIAQPNMPPDPSLRWKGPLTAALGRLAPLIDPGRPDRRLLAGRARAVDRRYFDERPDRLFNFSVTARAAASYLRFEPGIPWEEVATPVLVTIGDEDRMVSRAHTERCLEHARPPHATFLPFADMGHQLYLDHLDAALPPTLEWVQAALARSPAEVTA